MTALILDGKALARTLKDEVKLEVERLVEAGGPRPGLAILQADPDPSSAGYARAILKAAKGVGIVCTLHTFTSAEARQVPGGLEQQVVQRIAELNLNASVHGILIQTPLPASLRQAVVVEALSPLKDVDGVHPINAGRLFLNQPGFVPATPLGGMELLHRYTLPIAGKSAVVVGRSAIVGKPMAMMLMAENATVTVCHSRTPDLGSVTRQADILAVAVGKPGLIKAEMVKPGATVIDFGTTYRGNEVFGDVDFSGVSQVAGAITPVPGGTGPMTTSILLRQVMRAAQIAAKVPETAEVAE